MQCLVYDSVVSIYPSCVDLPLEKDYSPFTEAGDGRTVYAVKANGYINWKNCYTEFCCFQTN